MQVTRKHVIAIALVLVLAIPALALRKPYEDCESYTQDLNGERKSSVARSTRSSYVGCPALLPMVTKFDSG